MMSPDSLTAAGAARPIRMLLMAALLVGSSVACATHGGAHSEGRVHFLSPPDGAQLRSPITVRFGLEGKSIGPLKSQDQQLGHHHLIIDGAPVAAGATLPQSDSVLHFTRGQTYTELKLPPGRHTLTLQFGDGLERSYGPEFSSTITVEILAP